MNKSNSSAKTVIDSLTKLGNREHAKNALWFFKTAPGEYGEGDQFLGLRMPTIREQIKLYKPLPLETCVQLLQSEYHEIRMFALLMMVELFKPKSSKLKDAVFEAYMDKANRRQINNWDLVDCSCYKIVGPYLFDKARTPLFDLAKSDSLWDRRISIISTYHFIKHKDFEDVLKLADILLKDSEDLMHKAVGWMLKEIGKKDEAVLRDFLQSRYQSMPRTMLRTAIEKLEQSIRQQYLKGEI